jgi:hypothetical protein|tara:strand:- start:22553 stop:24190 length:1638 start_codon:yes stop_codon:yes gene_type:complete
MKVINTQAFCKQYPIGTMEAFVIPGYKRWITDTLYVIQSIHKITNYSAHHVPMDFIGPRQSYWYKPAYKLMSTELGTERALVVWDKDGLYNHSSYRTTQCLSYAKELHAENKVMFSRKNGMYMIDAIYYKVNPFNYYYQDGRTKSGLKAHLRQRLKGWAANSYVTREALYKFSDLFLITDTNMTIAETINEQLGNDYIIKCHLTQELIQKVASKLINLSGINRRVSRICTDAYLTSKGYSHNSSLNMWILENEVIVDGQCYNRDNLVLDFCKDCGKECPVDHLTAFDLCVDCAGMEYGIQNYSFKVEDELGFAAKSALETNIPYLGIEIEYQVENRQAGRFYVGNKMLGHALMKDDGSISNGFEIVSRPAMYHQHMKVYESFLDDLPDYIHPHKSCGMHVHISRKAFTSMGAGKLTEFINRQDNKNFMTLVAGRGSTNYQKPDSHYNITKPHHVDKGGYANRYNFVNLNNKATIELRIFSSPKNTKEFRIKMQFVNAMISYCQPAVLSGTIREQTHYKSFMSWLDKSKKEFKELHTHIKESSLCA